MTTSTWIVCMALLAGGPGEAVDDALTVEHLQPMLEAGDEAMIRETFRRHSGGVLPFIDAFLEGGLKMLEEGGDPEETLESYRIGVRYAELASDAFDDVSLVNYAVGFASWSPTEQRNFRAGQMAYGEGRTKEKADEHAQALDLFMQSWKLAQPLRDTWGMAMAAAGCARAERALEHDDEARRWAMRSERLYAGVRLHGSRVDMLMLASETTSSSMSQIAWLRSAWRVVVDRADDDARRARVQEALIAALVESGQENSADLVRNGWAPTNRRSRGASR